MKRGKMQYKSNSVLAEGLRNKFVKEIDFVIGATTHNLHDDQVRNIIAYNIAAAIRFSKTRREMFAKRHGLPMPPEDLASEATDIVKFARLVNTVKDFNEFKTRLASAFPKFSFEAIMTRWPLIDWNFRFDLPDDIIRRIIAAAQGDPDAGKTGRGRASKISLEKKFKEAKQIGIDKEGYPIYKQPEPTEQPKYTRSSNKKIAMLLQQTQEAIDAFKIAMAGFKDDLENIKARVFVPTMPILSHDSAQDAALADLEGKINSLEVALNRYKKHTHLGGKTVVIEEL